MFRAAASRPISWIATRRGVPYRRRSLITRQTSETRKRRPNPLRVSDAFRRFVLDQLDGLEDVHPRSMFGGVGLYCRGYFFGIIAGDVLYLKVDEMTRGDYMRAGMAPFCPYPERGGTMQYYAVPVSVLESAEELVQWARRAVRIAEGTATRSRRPVD